MLARLCRVFVSICLALLCSGGHAIAADASEQSPLFSFGVLTDVHYREGEPSGRMYYRESLKKLEECVREFNSKAPAFAVQLGDIIDRDFASFDGVLPIYGELKMPAYHVLGNHETWVAEDKMRSVPKRLGMQGEYYDFNVKGWRFVVLNANDLGPSVQPDSPECKELETIYEKLTDAGVPADKEWNKALGSQQTAWLENTLQEAAEAREKVIIFCHVPVFPSLLRLIDSCHCVVAYMNGHRHKGHYAFIGGVHYLNLRAMVETDETAYAIVEVCPDRLNVIGYGREPSRVLPIEPVPPAKDRPEAREPAKSPEPAPAASR